MPYTPDKPFSSFSFSAFMSYAHDDDQAWNWWISSFDRELNLALVPRLRGMKVPRTHLSSENGPIHGPLTDGLRRNVEASFAMLIFVHDNYLESDWCLEELEHFRAYFGDQGLRDRLYIIAMSKDAMEELKKKPAWSRLWPSDEATFLRFYQDIDTHYPIAVYPYTARQKRAVVAQEFWEEFVRLRESLAKQMKASVAAERPAPSYPSAAMGDTRETSEDPLLVRVYIESNPEQRKYWEPLSQQVAAAWDQVVALESVEPPLYLRPTGLPMSDIAQRPMLSDANGVVLLWGKKTPESLAAQISQVEPKLSGPRFAPGLVAYLMDGPTDQPSSATINNWPVVRFITRPDGSATVLADDALDLVKFLRKVLRHKRSP